jgi:hypothetical protein
MENKYVLELAQRELGITLQLDISLYNPYTTGLGNNKKMGIHVVAMRDILIMESLEIIADRVQSDLYEIQPIINNQVVGQPCFITKRNAINDRVYQDTYTFKNKIIFSGARNNSLHFKSLTGGSFETSTCIVSLMGALILNGTIIT